MGKTAIRKKFLTERNMLNNEDRILKSISIKEKLLSLPGYKRAKVVMFYSTIKSEVMTNEMIESAILSGKKKIGVPKTFTKEKKIKCIEINEDSIFEKGEFGIPEPVEGEVILKKDIDLIIIPAIAFDFYGNRLGYGGGYYDKFLNGTKALKVGVGFDSQLTDKLPVEKHDVKVDVIITEKRIVRFCGNNKSI